VGKPTKITNARYHLFHDFSNIWLRLRWFTWISCKITFLKLATIISFHVCVHLKVAFCCSLLVKCHVSIVPVRKSNEMKWVASFLADHAARGQMIWRWLILAVWLSTVSNSVAHIYEVILRRARLVLRWVTAFFSQHLVPGSLTHAGISPTSCGQRCHVASRRGVTFTFTRQLPRHIRLRWSARRATGRTNAAGRLWMGDARYHLHVESAIYRSGHVMSRCSQSRTPRRNCHEIARNVWRSLFTSKDTNKIPNRRQRTLCESHPFLQPGPDYGRYCRQMPTAYDVEEAY